MVWHLVCMLTVLQLYHTSYAVWSALLATAMLLVVIPTGHMPFLLPNHGVKTLMFVNTDNTVKRWASDLPLVQSLVVCQAWLSVEVHHRGENVSMFRPDQVLMSFSEPCLLPEHNIYMYTIQHHIFTASEFHDFGMWNFFGILTSHFPSVLLVFTRPLMGKLIFKGI